MDWPDLRGLIPVQRDRSQDRQQRRSGPEL